MRGVEALPLGVVQIEGLLREPPKKNSFTPDNRPDKGEFYFPDVKQMAELTGAEPIWVEATMGMLLHQYRDGRMLTVCRARIV